MVEHDVAEPILTISFLSHSSDTVYEYLSKDFPATQPAAVTQTGTVGVCWPFFIIFSPSFGRN